MTKKSYELIVNTNRDISQLYKMLGAYITSNIEKKSSCEGDYPYDTDDIIAAYTENNHTAYPDYFWWHVNTQFKGRNNEDPYLLASGKGSFYDKNFPDIIFSVGDTDEYVRSQIKAQIFKKFDAIVDPVDNSTLIDEVKVLIESDVFTTRFTKEYCHAVVEDYNTMEKLFAGYVVDKVEVPSEISDRSSMVIFLKQEPTKELVENMIARIHQFIDNYETILAEMDSEIKYFFEPTIEEVITDPANFKVVFVELVEHVTESNTKKIV